MKNKYNRLICKEEYVKINGIDQYLYHKGASYDNPVILYLHGGPGTAESIILDSFQKKWEEIFTIIHWDQRGAGKTLMKNPDKYPTIDLMLQDLFEIVQYLKEKYSKKKVIIFGHSWGTILGSIFIKRHPEDVEYYIGCGQVVSIDEGEEALYNKVKELAIQAYDKKTLKILDDLKNFLQDKSYNEFLGKFIKLNKIAVKYKLIDNNILLMLRSAIKSPIFRISDVFSLMKANKANKKTLEFVFNFDLRSEITKYEVPVYYVLGENDWQVPTIIAKKYFQAIDAPYKKIVLVPNAMHNAMIEQPELFFNELCAIKHDFECR